MKAGRGNGKGHAAIAMALAAALLCGPAHAGDRKKSPPGKIDAAVLYHNYCSVCHGDNGDGNSRAKNNLVPPPANFTDVKLQGKLTREYIAAIVRHGKPRTAMVSYTTQLNDAEIDAVAAYVRSAFVDGAGDVALRRGRTLYGHYCVDCHGINGGGVASAGKAPRDLASEAARREVTRDRLVSAVAVGRKGTAMSGFAGTLSATDIEAVADYVQKAIMTGSANAISGTSAHGGRERDPSK